MTEKETRKKRALVKEESTERPVNSNDAGAELDVPEHLRRVPPERRLPDGRVLKANGRAYTPGVGNPSHAHIPQEDRCSARKRNGDPCPNLPIKGANVCRVHGGSAPQVMRKAMALLQTSADKLVQGLLTIAMDENEPTAVRLAAMRDALDRAGIKSTEKVDVAHSMKPYEQALAGAMRVVPVSDEPTDPAILELRETTGDDRY